MNFLCELNICIHQRNNCITTNIIPGQPTQFSSIVRPLQIKTLKLVHPHTITTKQQDLLYIDCSLRMCITRTVCPRCSDEQFKISKSCPATLHELSVSLPISKTHQEKDSAPQEVEATKTRDLDSEEPCLLLSELCGSCVKKVEGDPEQVGSGKEDTVGWKRRLREFTQRRRGNAGPGRRGT